MTRTDRPTFFRRLVAASLLGLAAASPARPAEAQTTLSAQGGLEQYYKSEHWLPVQVTLTNQGEAVRAEVRARFASGEGGTEFRIPPRELQGQANQVHTLYIKSPVSYSTQALVLDLYRDGRLINTIRPPLRMLNDGDWLVVGIGAEDSTLKQLTTARLTNTQLAPSLRPWMRASSQPQVAVASLQPGEVPDRWQGLEAANMVVIGDVSEREFTGERAAALRDYVAAGGTLVITGGVDWQRLTSPFYSELLPVRVTGGGTLTGLPHPQVRGRGFSGGGTYPIALAEPLPGATVMDRHQGRPAIVRGTRGAGRVYFLAFDPARPPFRNWEGSVDFWKSLLLDPRDSRLLQAIATSEANNGQWNPGFGGTGGQPRLADAPYAISQLDIPAFYVVAIFLLAYIVVLVPVNYFVLKAKDKKEYAWLTTPAIVLVFSVAAYMIGYGFKGGRTLLVKVGVIEANTGQSAAPFVSYAGLFSPRKTGYDLQVAAGGDGAAGSPSALLSEPQSQRGSQGMRVLFEDSQKIEDFAVDMWAMRVVKTEGVARLGSGVTADLRRTGKAVSGKVRNQTPYALEDCHLLLGGRAVPVGTLGPGQEVSVDAELGTQGSGTLVPPSLLTNIKGSREEQRMKQAVLQPLSTLSYSNQGGLPAPNHPVLIGWVRESVARIQINGGTPREQSATLMVVHLK